MKLPFDFNINLVFVWRFIRRYILRKKPTQTQHFGLIKDKKDERDRFYVSRVRKADLPSSTERQHFKNFPFRWDQLDIGSCTGNGGAAAFIQALLRNGQQIFQPSRLFAYYNARTEDCKKEDSGASIRDVIKGLNKFGVCQEETWPYITSQFAWTPSEEAYREAGDHQTLEYYRIYPVTKEAIMNAVCQGYAVVYGQILYESFMKEEVARTGIVPNPRCWEEQVGGHCKCILDYEPEGVFELNSWGRKWGIDGGCLIPWKYVLDKNKSFDLWVIKLTE